MPQRESKKRNNRKKAQRKKEALEQASIASQSRPQGEAIVVPNITEVNAIVVFRLER